MNLVGKTAGRRAGRLLLPLILVGAASSCGLLLGLLRHVDDGNLGLSAARASLDFGEVWEQSDFSWNLVLENRGWRTITVSSFESTCGCSVLSTRELAVAAGTSALVPMRIDLSPRRPSDQSSSSFDFIVRIIPKFREGNNISTGGGWSVHGHVRRPLELAEDRVTFGDRCAVVRGAAMPTHVLRAKPLVGVKELRAWCEPDLVSAIVRRDTSGSDFAIHLTPHADLDSGTFRCKLWLQATMEDDQRLPAVRVAVDGAITNRVIAIPNSVDLGRRSINDVAELVVRLESPLDEPFHIEAITVDDVNDEPLAITPRAGSTGFLQLRKRLSRAGRYAAEATIRIRLENGDRVSIKLPIQGYVTEFLTQGG